MNHVTKIAIITSHTAAGYGLQKMLELYFALPSCTLYECIDQCSFPLVDKYDIYFVDMQWAMMHYKFFVPRKAKTILIQNQQLELENGFRSIYLQATVSQLIDQLQTIVDQLIMAKVDDSDTLSNREIDVLKLIIKGLINKEIAEELNISLNTVLTHRKNITNKLGIKTVSGLTLYAMMNGYAD